MFPYYAFSTSTEIKSTATPVDYVLLSTSTPYHVVGVRMQQEKDLSETILTCKLEGKDVKIAHNYAKDYPLDLIMFDCDGNATIHKTGADTAFVTMTYIPDWAIPVETVASTTVATNTPAYINGFSYGEILVAFFLLILVTNAFFGGILNRLIGVKQKTGYKIILK